MADHSKPSYELIPTIQTPEIDPGETVEISVYAAGYGQVDKADLHLSFDHPNLLNPEDPGRAILNIKHMTDEPTGLTAPITGMIQVQQFQNTSYQVVEARPFLWDQEAVYNVASEMQTIFPKPIAENKPDSTFPMILFNRPFPVRSRQSLSNFGKMDDRQQLDSIDDSLPPLKIELETLPAKQIFWNSNKDSVCEPGDYSITLTLTYGSTSRVYQDQKEVEVHVNNWVERNESLLRILAIIIAILTASPILIESILEIIRLFPNPF